MWNVGTGASMYVNATQEPWNKHYQMYTYITEELVQLIQNNFPVIEDKMSITGHRFFIFQINIMTVTNKQGSRLIALIIFKISAQILHYKHSNKLLKILKQAKKKTQQKL